MIKLIAIDIVGTLLDPERKITPEVKQAIAEAKAAGVKVVITTGRPLMGVHDILEELEKLGVPMACVTFRNPFELDRLSDSVYKLTAWEYSKRSVERAEEFFTK